MNASWCAVLMFSALLMPLCPLCLRDRVASMESKCRCLLRSLHPFLKLGGLWKASSIEQRPGTTTDNILSFKWTRFHLAKV
jgi:hypothetical protein